MTKPHEREPRDLGAYIGNEPELASETIPGGIRPDDERVAAHASQVGPTPPHRPSGHREASQADDDRREAGQNR